MDAPVDKPRQDGEENRTRLIVNYLPHSMTEKEMKDWFSKYGPLVSCVIKRDKISGESLEFGFVEYLKPEDAIQAITQLNGILIRKKKIKVSYSRPNTAEFRNTNLVVRNVPPGISEEDLLNVFKPHGKIIESKVLKNDNGNNTGIAFIRYYRRIEAENAMSKLNGYFFSGYRQTRSLDVKIKITNIKNRMCLAWLRGNCHRSDSDCPYKHSKTKDSMSLCKQWTEGKCTDHCRYRHYYMHGDKIAKTSQEESSGISRILSESEFTSPLKVTIVKETKKRKLTEIDLETGEHRSVFETVDNEIVDLTGKGSKRIRLFSFQDSNNNNNNKVDPQQQQVPK